MPTTSGDLWIKGNVGIGTGTKALAYKLDVNGGLRLGTLNFTVPGGDSGQSNNYYGIYQESGAWTPPYPDLRIQYHTGIKYDAYYGYGGHRFYTGYDGTGNPAGLTFSVGDGDQNVRVANTLITGGLQMVSGAGAGKVLTSDASGLASWQVASGVPTTRNVVTGSRSIGTTYLNTAGKVMFVTTTVRVSSGACGSGSSAYVKTDGTNPPTTVVASATTIVNTGAIGSNIPMSFVVLPNDYYRVDCIDSVPPCVPMGCPIVRWVEWY